MPKFSLKIFLPAAGLGERLRPITYHIPKPLLPVLGRPLIEITLKKFSAVSSARIGINLHYKPEMIKEWIKSSVYAARVELFPEDPILGTGGALKNAEEFLSDSHFLVHNADILSDIDFVQLIGTHLASENIATLATHDYPKYNNVVIDDNGYVIDVENPGTSTPNPDRLARKVAYTGIAVYSPEILKFLPDGVSHATVAWLAAARAGHKVQALDFTGCYWNDIGTPASYASAIINALRNEGETVYIHPLVKKCTSAEIDGYIVIEGENELGQNVSLRNCIVLEGSKIENSLSYENCILGPDFKIELNESEILHSDESGILIGTGGSARKYYRTKKDGKTAVLMKCREGDADYHRHIKYTKFFLNHNIPVPQLIEATPEKMSAIFEDLGDISLYSWLKCRRNPEDVEEMYRKVLNIDVQIHTGATANVSECPMLQSRLFDYEHYRWETGYFIERFVEGVRNIKPKNLSALQNEFHKIASKADSYPKTVIHRDFQSQNIMIHKGIPRLIDFQGARMGLPAYDVASILWDPYYRLEDGMRESLLGYYMDKMKNANSSAAAFAKADMPTHPALILCRLQRHMQALGAYGFLSSVIGKKYFLKHIPEGLRLLKEDVALVKDDYPELYGLVMGL
ncbi:MAG: sugar phosphate nucleotidyltransferase [Nitrospirota bacterium]|mgnify:CR=1 FL=1